jgi:metal transporter CNNM
MQGDDPVMAKYASRIYPLRKRGNLLLCTILIGNVSVNSTLSVVLDGMASSCPSFLAALFLSLRCVHPRTTDRPAASHSLAAPGLQ